MERKSTSFKRLKKSVVLIFKTVSYVYRKDFRGAVVRDIAFVIITVLQLYAIRVGGQFIDATTDILQHWESFTIKDYFYTESFQYLAIGLAIWIIINGLGNLREWLLNRITRIVTLEGENEVLNKMSTENMQEVERLDFQGLLTFVPNYSIERLISSYDIFSNIVQQLIQTISSMVILYEVIGSATFFLVAISVAEPVVMFMGENKMRVFRRGEVEGIKYLNYIRNIALDIPNFTELRVNGVFKYIKRKYWKDSVSFNNSLTELYKHFFIDKSFFAMVGRVLFIGFTIYLLAISVVKRLTIGDFKALFDYAENAYNGSYNVMRNVFRLMDDISYTDEFFALMEFEGFGDTASGSVKLKKSKTPVLRLVQMDFTYPGDKHKSLENISLEVNPGEKIAIVGGDGSGKSSLVKILCGLYAVQSGEYFLDDYSVRELERGELKNQLAVVFQDFVRYNFTIERNIMLSGETVRVNRSLYEESKKIAGVDKIMKREKLEDSQLLGKYFSGGREISPGYWQRIAIARMVYRNRNIFIMDEPFTYVDGPSRGEILANIFDFIGSEKSLIYITRSIENLKDFDRIYYLKKGRIVESGTYSELMKKKGEFYSSAKM